MVSDDEDDVRDPARHGTVDDRRAVGTWRVGPGEATSDLRINPQRGVRRQAWSGGILALCGAITAVLHLFGPVEWDRVVVAGLMSLGGALMWANALLERHAQVRLDAERIWLGRGLDRRTFRWDRVRTVILGPAGEQTVRVFLSNRLRRRGRLALGTVTFAAAPVAAEIARLAQAHGVDVSHPDWVSPASLEAAGAGAAPGSSAFGPAEADEPAAPRGTVTDERFVGDWSVLPERSESHLRERTRSLSRWVFLGSGALILLIMTIELAILHARLHVWLLVGGIVLLPFVPAAVWPWLRYRTDIVVTPDDLRRTNFPSCTVTWPSVTRIKIRSAAVHTADVTVETRDNSLQWWVAAPVADDIRRRAVEAGIPTQAPGDVAGAFPGSGASGTPA